jgi:hypothetical protein
MFVCSRRVAGPFLALRPWPCPRYNSHVPWVIAATSSIVIGNAAYDVAVSVHPQERVVLRQGIRVIREPFLRMTRDRRFRRRPVRAEPAN